MFKLKIDTKNAAFEENPAAEVKRIFETEVLPILTEMGQSKVKRKHMESQTLPT